MSSPQSPIDRLKVLLNSSTPIVVIETVEEMRAVSLVRMACSELSLAVFEWTIADGLVRSGNGAAAPQPVPHPSAQPRTDYRCVFVLKDFHRHMDSPVVVRRLREVGQKFSTNRRTGFDGHGLHVRERLHGVGGVVHRGSRSGAGIGTNR